MIRKNPNPSSIRDASNEFYTIIPHYSISLLNTEKIIAEKLDMLNSLTEMELAYNLIKDDYENIDLADQDPIDFHYKHLQCELDVVARGRSFFF